MKKKIGRPTNAIKNFIIKARIDAQTKDKLRYCEEVLKMSKSSIIRKGIETVYNELKGENKQ